MPRKGGGIYEIINDMADLEGRVGPLVLSIRPAPVPTPELCDEPIVCLSLNAEWASHIRGAIALLLYDSAWVGTDAELFKVKQGLQQLLVELSMPCINQGDEAGMTVDLTSLSNDLTTEYDGTSESIDTNAPNDTFDSDVTDTQAEADCRRPALCQVVTNTVALAALLAAKRLEGVTSAVQMVSSIPASLASFFKFGGAMTLTLMIGGWVLNQVLEIFEDVGTSLLTDSCLQQAVSCCAYNSLLGKPITFENFATALDDCPGLSPNAELVRSAIAPIFHEYNVFLAFVLALGASERGCLGGSLEGCHCTHFCTEWDLTHSNGQWTIGFGPPSGQWIDGVGWEAQCFQGIGQAAVNRLFIKHNMDNRELTHVKIEYSYDFGHEEPAQAWMFRFHCGTAEHLLSSASIPQGDHLTLEFDVTGGGIDPSFQLYSSYDNVGSKTCDGYARIHKIEISGLGVNPFESCDSCWPFLET